MKAILLLLALTTINLILHAQTSVVQDTKGETSLSLGSIGVVAINAKDESISFSYGIAIGKEDTAVGVQHRKFNYLGFSARGRGTNGTVTAIKNAEFQYDGNIGLFFFQDRTLNNKNIQWYVSSDLIFRQFKLIDDASTIAFDKQVYDKNSHGYRATIGINLTGDFLGTVPYVLGIALNGGHSNNLRDIKPLEISNFTTQNDTTGTQVRSIQRGTTNAYDIAEFRNNIAYSNLNIDFGPQILNQCLLLFHSRWSVQEDRKPQWNPALGLYFTKAGAPLEVVAGIQIQTLDWFNTAESLSTRNQRTPINIVAGFTF